MSFYLINNLKKISEKIFYKDVLMCNESSW